MIIVVLVALLWAPVVAIMLLCVLHVRIPPIGRARRPHPQPASAEISSASDPDVPSWSPLDDHQLTRLLIDAAPRSITE